MLMTYPILVTTKQFIHNFTSIKCCINVELNFTVLFVFRMNIEDKTDKNVQCFQRNNQIINV